MQSLSLNPSVQIGRLISVKLRLSLKNFCLASLIVVSGLLAFYIFQINAIIKSTYAIAGLEAGIKKISEQNRSLEDDVLRSNSLGKIEGLAKNLNFEQVTDVRYIQVLENYVGIK